MFGASFQQNTVERGSTSEEGLLPKRGEFIHHDQFQGVHFPCASPFCKQEGTILAFICPAGPKGGIWDTWWTEIACTVCGARYLIRWPASDEGSVTVVQRIEEPRSETMEAGSSLPAAKE
jgi:hypothetical protein